MIGLWVFLALPRWVQVDRFPVGTFHALEVDRTRKVAFVLGYQDVVLLDYHDPSRMAYLGRVNVGRPIQDAVYDSLRKVLFLLDRSGGFVSLDVSRLDQPRMLADIPGSGRGARMFLYRTKYLVILEERAWLHLWDVGDPAFPVWIASRWTLMSLEYKISPRLLHPDPRIRPRRVAYREPLLVMLDSRDTHIVVWDLSTLPEINIQTQPITLARKAKDKHFQYGNFGQFALHFRRDTLLVFHSADVFAPNGAPIKDASSLCVQIFRFRRNQMSPTFLHAYCGIMGRADILTVHGPYVVGTYRGFGSSRVNAVRWDMKPGDDFSPEKRITYEGFFDGLDAKVVGLNQILLLNPFRLSLRHFQTGEEISGPRIVPAKETDSLVPFEVGKLSVLISHRADRPRIAGFLFVESEGKREAPGTLSGWKVTPTRVHTPYRDIPIRGVAHLVPFPRDVVVFQIRRGYGRLGVLQAFHWDGRRWHRTLYVPTSVYPLPNGLFKVNDRCVLLTAREVELYCMKEGS